MSKKLYAAHILKLILVAVFFYVVTTLLINAVVTSPNAVYDSGSRSNVVSA
jgi:hypothetical protein